MSAESRALLGMGIDDGSREKEDAEEKERNRKRSLLLQAEGKRKPGELGVFWKPSLEAITYTPLSVHSLARSTIGFGSVQGQARQPVRRVDQDEVESCSAAVGMCM